MGRREKYKLKWEEKGIQNVPIRLKKSVTSKRNDRPDTHLICNECGGRVGSQYKCKECGETYGHYNQIDKRVAEVGENEIIFEEEERQEFVSQEYRDEFRIIDEVDINQLIPYYLNRLNSGKMYEIMNNSSEKIRKLVQEIIDYITLKNKFLIVRYDYYGIRTGILTVVVDNEGKIKLSVIPLRDNTLIRPRKQKGTKSKEHTEDREKIDKLSRNPELEKENEYFDKKVMGEDIEIEMEEEEKEEEEEFGELTKEVKVMREDD